MLWLPKAPNGLGSSAFAPMLSCKQVQHMQQMQDITCVIRQLEAVAACTPPHIEGMNPRCTIKAGVKRLACMHLAVPSRTSCCILMQL
jgi:hypothetical protein